MSADHVSRGNKADIPVTADDGNDTAPVASQDPDAGTAEAEGRDTPPDRQPSTAPLRQEHAAAVLASMPGHPHDTPSEQTENPPQSPGERSELEQGADAAPDANDTSGQQDPPARQIGPALLRQEYAAAVLASPQGHPHDAPAFPVGTAPDEKPRATPLDVDGALTGDDSLPAEPRTGQQDGRQTEELQPSEGPHEAVPEEPAQPEELEAPSKPSDLAEQRELKPWPTDPDNGYTVQVRDLEFLQITTEQVEWWRKGEAPLGMRPEQFRDFSESLVEALESHDISADDLQADLVGSSVRFFSGWTKLLDDIPLGPEVQSKLIEWFGDDENRPARRPFDAMYKLGASDKPSDYDISIRSDRMVEIARQRWLASGAEESFSHSRQGFVDGRIVQETFPEITGWSQRWSAELGRKVSCRLFGLNEEPIQRRASQSSGNDAVWPVHPREAQATVPEGMRPWPEDPANGYRLQARDLRFLGISADQVEWWRRSVAPLGMTPDQYGDFRSTLADALRRDGVTISNTDIRLKGSSINFFSNRRKELPTEAAIADTPESAALMRQWLGDDPARPASRPFDSMHKLGLSEQPSDYDIQIRSDQMVEIARQRYEADPSQQMGPFAHEKYNFVNKEVVRGQFPALHEWVERWEAEFGREVSPALFGLDGEPRQSTDPERLKRGWPLLGRDSLRADPALRRAEIAQLDPDSPVLRSRPRPPGEAPPLSTAEAPLTTADGAWSWRGRRLEAMASQAVDEFMPQLADAAHGTDGQGGIQAKMLAIEQRLDTGRLDGLEHDLKSIDRLKEKVAKRLENWPDASPDQILSGIPDGVRYTFIFGTEHYTEGYWQVHAELTGRQFEPVHHNNAWMKEEIPYQGINTQWRDPETSTRFEVQFHTPESQYVTKETHRIYEIIGNPKVPVSEQQEWARYEREYYALVPVPDGVANIKSTEARRR